MQPALTSSTARGPCHRTRESADGASPFRSSGLRLQAERGEQSFEISSHFDHDCGVHIRRKAFAVLPSMEHDTATVRRLIPPHVGAGADRTRKTRNMSECLDWPPCSSHSRRADERFRSAGSTLVAHDATTSHPRYALRKSVIRPSGYPTRSNERRYNAGSFQSVVGFVCETLVVSAASRSSSTCEAKASVRRTSAV